MTKNHRKSCLGLALLLLPLAGCTRDHKFQPVDMWNYSRLKPYEEVDTPAGTTALPIPVGAIARGQLRENDALYTGKLNGQLVTAFPFAITDEVVVRGQQRYTIYCSPCHGGLGDGKGLIISRGFAKPPDYTEQRLVDAPVGHFYDVITNGYGAMYSYAARVPVNDRWAIIAYIRVLQKTRAHAKDHGGTFADRTMPGGGVYSPNLRPTNSLSEHKEGGLSAVEGEGVPEHKAPGIGRPDSSTFEKPGAATGTVGDAMNLGAEGKGKTP